MNWQLPSSQPESAGEIVALNSRHIPLSPYQLQGNYPQPTRALSCNSGRTIIGCSLPSTNSLVTTVRSHHTRKNLTCKEHHLKMEHSQIWGGCRQWGRGGWWLSNVRAAPERSPGLGTAMGSGLRHIPLWVEWVYNGMTWMGSYNQKNTLTFTLHRCSSIMTHHVYAHQFLGKSPTRLTQCVSQANKISDITHVKNAVPPPPQDTWFGHPTLTRKDYMRIVLISEGKQTKYSNQHYLIWIFKI